ncbi:MAG: hypothetical protein WC797_00540 [Candidatus Paceibacterota bacterium]|jgi:hypothetical protein
MRSILILLAVSLTISFGFSSAMEKQVNNCPPGWEYPSPTPASTIDKIVKPSITIRDNGTPESSKLVLDSVYSPYWNEYIFTAADDANGLYETVFVGANKYNTSARTEWKPVKNVGLYGWNFFGQGLDTGLVLGNLDANRKYDFSLDLSFNTWRPSLLMKTPLGILGPMSFNSKQDIFTSIHNTVAHSLLHRLVMSGTHEPKKPLARVAEHLTAKTVAKAILGKSFIGVVVVKRVLRLLHIF